MDIRTFKIFSEYNKKANNEMNAIIRTLEPDQWNQEFGGYFNSIKSLCNHVYICDFNWLKRFSKLREFQYIKHGFFAREMKFGSIILKTVTEYETKRNEFDDHIDLFVHEINPRDLDEVLTYTDSHGREYKRLFSGLVLHMFNHQTHHRGMISIYLEELGKSNDFSNLMNLF
jgi:uncharacterized damage-inducible protein DinB